MGRAAPLRAATDQQQGRQQELQQRPPGVVLDGGDESDDVDTAGAGSILDTLQECIIGHVTLDNETSERYTIVRVEAGDYSGLLRSLAWTITGLNCCVAHARLRTDSDGAALDTFYLTDARGRKLGERAAHDVAERLQEVVRECRAGERREFKEARVGDLIWLSNESHPDCTELVITPENDSPELLFDLASVIHAMGVSVYEGAIRSAPPPPDAPSGGGGGGGSGGSGESGRAGSRAAGVDADMAALAAAPLPAPGRRSMRFLLRDARGGGRLGAQAAAGLLYAMQISLGHGAPSRLPTLTR